MPSQQPSPDAIQRTNADEALHELLAGNGRFVKGETLAPRRSPAQIRALADGQNPWAVLVSCADSRVAPEILFDVGVGDIFVVRVAGNVVDPSGVAVKGSIEFAVAELGVPLILVLGHSRCGAVTAAVRRIEHQDPVPGALAGLVELIRPAVLEGKKTPGDLVENAVHANVEQGVARLRALEPVIAPRVRDGRVRVVGAVYDLRTGVVQVL